eukprot:jgi/Bigna1/83494/fgenesh1_pg.109_\
MPFPSSQSQFQFQFPPSVSTKSNLMPFKRTRGVNVVSPATAASRGDFNLGGKRRGAVSDRMYDFDLEKERRKTEANFEHMNREKKQIARIQNLQLGSPIVEWLVKYWQDRQGYHSMDILCEVKYVEMKHLCRRAIEFESEASLDLSSHFRIAFSLHLLDSLYSQFHYHQPLQELYNLLRNTIGSMILVDHPTVDVRKYGEFDFSKLFTTTNYADIVRATVSECTQLEHALLKLQPTEKVNKLRSILSHWVQIQISKAAKAYRGIVFWIWKNARAGQGEVIRVVQNRIKRRNLLLKRIMMGKWRLSSTDSRINRTKSDITSYSVDNVRFRSTIRSLLSKLDIVKKSLKDLDKEKNYKDELKQQTEGLEKLYKYCEVSSRDRKLFLSSCVSRIIFPTKLALTNLKKSYLQLSKSTVPSCQNLENYPLLSTDRKERAKLPQSRQSVSSNFGQEEDSTSGSEKLLLAWANQTLRRAKKKGVFSMIVFIIQPQVRRELADAYIEHCFDWNQPSPEEKRDVEMAILQLKKDCSVDDILQALFTLFLSDKNLYKISQNLPQKKNYGPSGIKRLAITTSTLNLKPPPSSSSSQLEGMGESLELHINRKDSNNGVEFHLISSPDTVIQLHSKAENHISALIQQKSKVTSLKKEMETTRNCLFQDLFSKFASNIRMADGKTPTQCRTNELLGKEDKAQVVQKPLPPPDIMPDIVNLFSFLNLDKRAEMTEILMEFECLLANAFLKFSAIDPESRVHWMCERQFWWMCRDCSLDLTSEDVCEVFKTVSHHAKYRKLSKFDVTHEQLEILAATPSHGGAINQMVYKGGTLKKGGGGSKRYDSYTGSFMGMMESYSSNRVLKKKNRGSKKHSSLFSELEIVGEMEREDLINFGQFVIALCSLGLAKFQQHCTPIRAVKNFLMMLKGARVHAIHAHLEYRRDFRSVANKDIMSRYRKEMTLCFKAYAQNYPETKSVKTLHLLDLENMCTMFGIFPKHLSTADIQKIFMNSSQRGMGIGRFEFEEVFYVLAFCVDPTPYHSVASKVAFMMDNFITPKLVETGRLKQPVGCQSPTSVRSARRRRGASQSSSRSHKGGGAKIASRSSTASSREKAAAGYHPNSGEKYGEQQGGGAGAKPVVGEFITFFSESRGSKREDNNREHNEGGADKKKVQKEKMKHKKTKNISQVSFEELLSSV